MGNKTFILSDQTVNCYGSIILTSGIDTSRFERNPVMLYMHDRNRGIIGRWENIRKEGNNLLADAVFDTGGELGAEVARQVENGFIRAVSIGVDILETTDTNGATTVTKCVLDEVSIVDIPANSNALRLCRFGKAQANNDAIITAQLIELLGLEHSATNAEIIDAVKALLQDDDTAEKAVDTAIEQGLISAGQRDNFIRMNKSDHACFNAFVNAQKEERDRKIKSLVDSAVGGGKVLEQERGVYDYIGNRLGIATLSRVFDTMPGRAKLSEILQVSKASGDRSGWTLNDYRKYAFDELRKDPQLYKRLVEKEKAEQGVSVKNLEYYRRHNPEYLREHPEIYKQLVQEL